MGSTLKNLSNKAVGERTVFNNRFVVEVCEKIHVHYRNLRIVMSQADFAEFAMGMRDAFDRWFARGCPEPGKDKHIELCRKKVATDTCNEGIKINLNRNLYNKNKGSVYAEGAEFSDQLYVHLKIRDLRLEMSIEEFEEYADVIKEASRRLKDGDITALLPKEELHG